MRQFIITIVFLCSVCLSCQNNNEVSVEVLQQYIADPENGVSQTAIAKGVQIEMAYKPNALIIAQEIDGIQDIEERESIIRNYDSLSYFVLRLSKGGKELESYFVSDRQRLINVVNYLSSDIASDIQLITETDTLKALTVAYTRMFGSSNATTVMPVFDHDVRLIDGPFVISYNDTHFGLGLNEFVFDSKNVKKIPTIKFN